MFSEQFSYSGYQQLPHGEVMYDDDFNWKGHGEKGFYWLRHLDDSKPAGMKSNWGIKFHISINDSRGCEANLASAWDHVKEIIYKHKIKHAKVVNETLHYAENPSFGQQGKQITIYASEDARANDPVFWQIVLQEIVNALTLAKIDPDPNGGNYKGNKVSGNQYVHYRCDAKVNDNYQGHIVFIKYLEEQRLAGHDYTKMLELNVEGNVRKQYLPRGNVDLQGAIELFQIPENETPQTMEQLVLWVRDNESDFLGDVNDILVGEFDVFGQSATHNDALCDPFEGMSVSPSCCTSLCRIFTALSCCRTTNKSTAELEEPLVTSSSSEQHATVDEKMVTNPLIHDSDVNHDGSKQTPRQRMQSL